MDKEYKKKEKEIQRLIKINENIDKLDKQIEEINVKIDKILDKMIEAEEHGEIDIFNTYATQRKIFLSIKGELVTLKSELEVTNASEDVYKLLKDIVQIIENKNTTNEIEKWRKFHKLTQKRKLEFTTKKLLVENNTENNIIKQNKQIEYDEETRKAIENRKIRSKLNVDLSEYKTNNENKTEFTEIEDFLNEAKKF